MQVILLVVTAIGWLDSDGFLWKVSKEFQWSIDGLNSLVHLFSPGLSFLDYVAVSSFAPFPVLQLFSYIGPSVSPPLDLF